MIGLRNTRYVASLTSSVVVVPVTVYTDTFESYTASVNLNLNALNGGVGWTGAYAARSSYASIWDSDTFQSYTVSANLDGLNGEVFAGPYVVKLTFARTYSSDTMETYAVASDIGGQDGGLGWGGAYVSR